MSAKIYWNLLVFVGVLCQVITGTLSKKDIDESSKLLIRQKRVINCIPGGDVRERIRNVPYTVSVKQFRGPGICAGVILTHHIVLTVAKCVELDVGRYVVHAGSAQIARGSHPTCHRVTSKRTNTGGHAYRPTDGIALITVNPPFIFSVNTESIGLYEGHIEPGFNAIISGWGCNLGHPGTAHPNHLRTITVPIISNHDCAILYLRAFAISNSDICTLDATGHQYCGVDDAGAPLAIDVAGVKKLVGIHLWNGGVVGRSNPDVFVRLQHPTYKTWIAETIRILEAHLNNI